MGLKQGEGLLMLCLFSGDLVKNSERKIGCQGSYLFCFDVVSQNIFKIGYVSL